MFQKSLQKQSYSNLIRVSLSTLRASGLRLLVACSDAIQWVQVPKNVFGNERCKCFNIRVLQRRSDHAQKELILGFHSIFLGRRGDGSFRLTNPRKLIHIQCEFSQTLERRTAMKGTRQSEEQIIAILKQGVNRHSSAFRIGQFPKNQRN